jgi:hypothetical protein
MAIALEGRVYAQIVENKVHWVFDKSKLPEWNNDHCPAIDITDLDPRPQQGWDYDGVNFTAPVPNVEYAWQILREERNYFLSKTDWTQMPDARNSMTEERRNAWDQYRQALRDLPENTIDPFNVTWPIPPVPIDI